MLMMLFDIFDFPATSEWFEESEWLMFFLDRLLALLEILMLFPLTIVDFTSSCWRFCLSLFSDYSLLLSTFELLDSYLLVVALGFFPLAFFFNKSVDKFDDFFCIFLAYRCFKFVHLTFIVFGTLILWDLSDTPDNSALKVNWYYFIY